MRSRLKLGSPSGESMLIFGRALSRQRSVPRMWQARMRIEKSTGWWHASERPKPSSTKRANDSRLLRGSSSGSDDFSAVECVRARVTAHVAHTRLEQGLGDREDALAAQDLPRAVAELLDVLRERALTHRRL